MLVARQDDGDFDGYRIRSTGISMHLKVLGGEERSNDSGTADAAAGHYARGFNPDLRHIPGPVIKLWPWQDFADRTFFGAASAAAFTRRYNSAAPPAAISPD